MDDSLIPISYAVHWSFCPRRVWLESQGEEGEFYAIDAGINAHKRVDASGCRGPGESSAVELRNDALGIVGRADIVRTCDGKAHLREYKSTPVRRDPQITEGMRVQLALQRACLLFEGYDVDTVADIYFVNHNKVVPVELNEADMERAVECVQGAKEAVFSDYAPEPLDDWTRCSGCSHEGLCLPAERGLGVSLPVRKVRPPLREGRTVYLATPGSYAHLKKGRMVVDAKGERIAEVPLEAARAVCVQGNANLSSGLIRELLERNIPIQWCMPSGRLSGWAISSCGPNAATRSAQHIASAAGRLDFAQEFISSKIANQATQLRRAGGDAGVVKSLRGYQRLCAKTHSLTELFGVEGRAASLYFANWPYLLKDDKGDAWPWGGRLGRPARDPINAMLNYTYSLLVAEEVKAITACGLDPHAGFLHSLSRNKPALALDLMEEMRAPIADSAVQTVINCRVVSPEDFLYEYGSVKMKRRARDALIKAFERRLSTEFMHPLFRYKVTWRRALEVQARQVLGVLEGSQRRYAGVRMR